MKPARYLLDTKKSLHAGAGERLAVTYDRHGPGLYRYALMLCARHALAEDAVQQAFAKLAGLGERISTLQSPPDYLRVAVRRECYRLLQLPRMAALEDAAEPALLESAGAGLERDEQRCAVEAALRSLPAEQREIVHLKVYEGLTLEAIAALVGIPANTAASRYRYALEKLRERLAALQNEDAP